MSNYYKIGEFSKYLGVTPDFLKHYEQYSLIEPSITKANYRYYRFEKSSEAIECIRLKNLGFSLKEMKTMIHEANLDEIVTSYQKKAEEMQSAIHYYQAMIDEIKRFESWVELVHSNQEWSIVNCEEEVFLPHTINRDFIKNSELYDLLSEWTKWLPVVHSAQKIYDCFDEDKKPYFHWGYSVSKKFAEENNLPMGATAVIIPRRKCLIFHNCLADEENVLTVEDTVNKAKRILDQHNLVPVGEIYRVVYHYSHEDGKIVQHSSIIIPLKS